MASSHQLRNRINAHNQKRKAKHLLDYHEINALLSDVSQLGTTSMQNEAAEQVKIDEYIRNQRKKRRRKQRKSECSDYAAEDLPHAAIQHMQKLEQHCGKLISKLNHVDDAFVKDAMQFNNKEHSQKHRKASKKNEERSPFKLLTRETESLQMYRGFKVITMITREIDEIKEGAAIRIQSAVRSRQLRYLLKEMRQKLQRKKAIAARLYIKWKVKKEMHRMTILNTKANNHFESRLLKKLLNTWKMFIAKSYLLKYGKIMQRLQRAKYHYSIRLANLCFQKYIKFVSERKISSTKINRCLQRRYKRYMGETFSCWIYEYESRKKYRLSLIEIFLTCVPLMSHNSARQMGNYERAKQLRKTHEQATLAYFFPKLVQNYAENKRKTAIAFNHDQSKKLSRNYKQWLYWSKNSKRIKDILQICIYSREKMLCKQIINEWRKWCNLVLKRKKMSKTIIDIYNIMLQAKHWRSWSNYIVASKRNLAFKFFCAWLYQVKATQKFYQGIEINKFELKYRFRSWVCYTQFQKALKIIQKQWKKKYLFRFWKRCNKAAIIIQSFWRKILAKESLRKCIRLRDLRSYMKAEKEMLKEIDCMTKEDLLSFDLAARTIQRSWRFCVNVWSRCEEEREFSFLMLKMLRKKQREKSILEKEDKRMLILHMKKIQDQKFINAIRSIQIFFRFNQLRKKLKAFLVVIKEQMAIKIQCVYRGVIKRRVAQVLYYSKLLHQDSVKLMQFQLGMIKRLRLKPKQNTIFLKGIEKCNLEASSFYSPKILWRLIYSDYKFFSQKQLPKLKEVVNEKSLNPYHEMVNVEATAHRPRPGNVVKVFRNFDSAKSAGKVGILLNINKTSAIGHVKFENVIVPIPLDIEPTPISKFLHASSTICKLKVKHFGFYISKANKNEKWKEVLTLYANIERKLAPRRIAARSIQKWFQAIQYNFLFRKKLRLLILKIEKKRLQVFSVLNGLGLATVDVANFLCSIHAVKPEHIPLNLDDRKIEIIDILKGMFARLQVSRVHKELCHLSNMRDFLKHTTCFDRFENDSDRLILLSQRRSYLKCLKSDLCQCARYMYSIHHVCCTLFERQESRRRPYEFCQISISFGKRTKTFRSEYWIGKWTFPSLQTLPRGTKNVVFFSGTWIRISNYRYYKILGRKTVLPFIWIPHGLGYIYFPSCFISSKSRQKISVNESCFIRQIRCNVFLGRIVEKQNVQIQFGDLKNCNYCRLDAPYCSLSEHWCAESEMYIKCQGPIYDGPLMEDFETFSNNKSEHRTWTLANDDQYFGVNVNPGFHPDKATGIYGLNFPNGYQYIGGIVKGKMCKYGRRDHNEDYFSSNYIGEWNNGLYHGSGQLYFENGGEGCPQFMLRLHYIVEQYIGEWRNGKKHGIGKGTQIDGSSYIGQYKYNSFHGFGTLKHPNNDSYEGEFANNLKHGKGKLISNCCQEKYWGGFKNDMKDGWGVWKLQNGDIYHGFFTNGEMDGIGIYTWRKITSATARRMGKWRKGDLVRWLYWIPDKEATDEFCDRFKRTSDYKGIFAMNTIRTFPHLAAGVNPLDPKVKAIVLRICQFCIDQEVQCIADKSINLIGKATSDYIKKNMQVFSTAFCQKNIEVNNLCNEIDVLTSEIDDLKLRVAEIIEKGKYALTEQEELQMNMVEFWKVKEHEEVKTQFERTLQLVLDIGSSDWRILSKVEHVSYEIRKLLSSIFMCLKINCPTWEDSIRYMKVTSVVNGVERVELMEHILSFDVHWLADTPDGQLVYRKIRSTSKERWCYPSSKNLSVISGRKKPCHIMDTLCNWLLAIVDYIYDARKLTESRARIKELTRIIDKYEYIETSLDENNADFGQEDSNEENEENLEEYHIVNELLKKESLKAKIMKQYKSALFEKEELHDKIDQMNWEVESLRKLKEEDVVDPEVLSDILTQLHTRFMNRIDQFPYQI